jgi:hypothetical protein
MKKGTAIVVPFLFKLKIQKGAPQYFSTFSTFFIQKNYLCARLKKIALSCQQ